MKSPRIILLILVPLALLGAIFFVSTRPTEAPSEEETQQLLPEGTSNERGEVIQGEPNGGEGESNPKRVESMEYVSENISNISPRDPILGGSWQATRFWFVDDENFYVEYEDGRILRKVLISEVDDSYTVTGYFEPGENDWNLVEGKDPYFGTQLDLYEFSGKANAWVKRN